MAFLKKVQGISLKKEENDFLQSESK